MVSRQCIRLFAILLNCRCTLHCLSVLVQFFLRSYGFSLVTSHSQHLSVGPRVQSTDNSPIEVFIVVALSWWHLCHLETWRQGTTSFPWTSEWPVHRDPVPQGERVWRISCPRRPCEEGRKPSDHKCLQEAHPHRLLPPLHLTPPPKSEVWYSRLPPQQSWSDLQTRFCPGRGKEPCPECADGKWLPEMSSCKGAEKEAKCVSEWWPKTRVLLPYIKGISEKISIACKPLGIEATLPFQEYPQEIPP